MDNLTHFGTTKINTDRLYLKKINIADESADDNFCISLIKNYENSEDKGNFISFDDAVKMCGVDTNEIQN